MPPRGVPSRRRIPISRRRWFTLAQIELPMDRPPTTSTTHRNAKDTFFTSAFVSICVATICGTVVIFVSGRTLRSLPSSPSVIALQQPMISMDETWPGVATRRCMVRRWTKTRSSSTVPVSGSTASTVSGVPPRSTVAPFATPRRVGRRRADEALLLVERRSRPCA